MNSTTALDEPVASFLIALPPGWARLPARDEDAAELRMMIEDIVAEALPDTLPRDSAEPWRGEFRKRLSRAVAEAGDAGAGAVYLPVRPINGVTIPASLIESEIEDTERDEPGAMIAAIISDPLTGGEQRIVDGARAARTDTVTTRVTPKGDWPEVTTRQVVYTIETPHRRGRWVVMSFSAVSGDNPSAALSDALVMLFDALMTTFRWAAVPGAEISSLEARLRTITPVHPGEDTRA